jgi:hypothetical protein
MKIDFVDLYGTKISLEDGHIGLHNFYQYKWVREAVKARYPRQKQTLYCDLLRSEHIPFNFFGPFINSKDNLVLLTSVLNKYMKNTIKFVERVLVEYAPSPRINYLDDATSFDVYIEYIHAKDGSKGIIGIEVKYTEPDYPIGEEENRKVNDPNSTYWAVTNQSKIYHNPIYASPFKDIISSDRFRQIWRNHLLGESIKQKHPDTYKHFTLVMLYPEGNTHISDITNEYPNLLQPNDGLKFIPITYQSFLDECNEINKDMFNEDIYLWLDYCMKRYNHE